MFTPRPYTPPTLGRSLGSPGPTVHEATPIPDASTSADSGPSQPSLIDRPQNPLARDLALGGDALPNPFAQSATTDTTPSADQRWTSYTTSSDSRPSPVYLGNGRYRLANGEIHEIAHEGRRHRRTNAVHLGGGEPLSDDADESDLNTDESSPPENPIGRLHNAVQSLNGFSSPAAQEAMQDLEAAVASVIETVNSLIEDVDIHAHHAEEQRHQIEDLTQELVEVNHMVQERDQMILRLENPSTYGEPTTPPLYASDAQAGHESMMTPRRPQVPTNSADVEETRGILMRTPQTVLRNPSRAHVPASPTPGAHATASSSERMTSEQASAGSTPPSYRAPSQDETSPQALSLEAESPPSEESGESDNTHLRRAPCFRTRSL